MNQRTLAILAALATTIIYGINHTVAKGVMPIYVKPFGFILLRVIGAAILFWIASFFIPKEKIDKQDWPKLILCSIFGMAINMLGFFKGLELSTPINSAVLITVTPIITVILSAFLIKEKIKLLKATGIIIGFIGAVTLILFGAKSAQNAPNIPLGNILFIVNCVCYGTYLILVKKLIEKYHLFRLMKWMFTIGIVINLPITFSEASQIQWVSLPIHAIASIGFVIFCTTFLTYLFNGFALTQLKASTVSAFVYVQPLIGIIFALVTGKDTLNTLKIGATLLIFIGVYLATKKPKLNL
ncbi:DMT family transporter [uncultured Maribacter sp.]|uniref:DMT family transporter n=1 Tax=uncultured Maribacter sp. TaxID=431308 RepID=UPI00261DF47C|nr:DMT family transporter [uncultured Maribacter sp.]